MNTQKVIEYYAQEKEAFKEMLHEICSNDLEVPEDKLTPEQEGILAKLRDQLKDFINPDISNFDLARSFMSMCYTWADMRTRRGAVA